MQKVSVFLPAGFNRHAEIPGHGLYGLFGNITVVFLNVLKHFNELIGLTTTSFQDLIERLGWHVNLLQLRVNLTTLKVPDNLVNVYTEKMHPYCLLIIGSQAEESNEK